MGTVIRRLSVLAAIAALLVPAAAKAGTTTYTAPYEMGPQGGDSFNTIQADPATGEMTVIRGNPAGVSASLGCAGSGGFANFQVTHEATSLTSVVVNYSTALVDPYSWINVGVRQGDGFLGSRVERGIIAGDGHVTVDLASPADGPVVVWFGLQVSSACPNVEVARAAFTSVEMHEG